MKERCSIHAKILAQTTTFRQSRHETEAEYYIRASGNKNDAIEIDDRHLGR